MKLRYFIFAAVVGVTYGMLASHMPVWASISIAGVSAVVCLTIILNNYRRVMRQRIESDNELSNLARDFDRIA